MPGQGGTARPLTCWQDASVYRRVLYWGGCAFTGTYYQERQFTRKWSVSWTSWSMALLLRPTHDVPHGVGISDQAPLHIRWEVCVCSFPSLARGHFPTLFRQRRNPQTTSPHYPLPGYDIISPPLYTVVSRNSPLHLHLPILLWLTQTMLLSQPRVPFSHHPKYRVE